jgi:hypothetical protein
LFLLALLLSVIVSQDATRLTLHYPKEVKWEWICVDSYGKLDDKQNPGGYVEWWGTSCWKPYFSIEDYNLRRGALTIVVTLTTSEGDITVKKYVKPEEGRFPDDLVPFPRN